MGRWPLAESVIASGEFPVPVNQQGSSSLEGETAVFKLYGWVADVGGVWSSGGFDATWTPAPVTVYPAVSRSRCAKS